MRYMMMIKATKEYEAGIPPSPELMAGMGKLTEEMTKAGVLLASEGLQPSSKGTRIKLSDGKRIVTDGPFAETREVIGGYAILEAKSKEEAIKLGTASLAFTSKRASRISRWKSARCSIQRSLVPGTVSLGISRHLSDAEPANFKPYVFRRSSMIIFGKRLSEYLAFSKPFLGSILVVGAARLALSLGGVPNSAARWLSITAVMWIGILYFSVRIHTGGFGSYQQLLPICVLQSLTAQVIIVPAIVLAIFTGNDNIYSAPEFSFGVDGKTWSHVGAHLLVGTSAGSLVGWLVGCLILFATKKLAPKDKDANIAVRA